MFLSGARRRALLARLLVDPDRFVSSDALVSDVWEGKSAAVSVATLHSHISQLRKVLGPCVQSRPGAYKLSLDSAVVDAIEFERQAHLGASQLSSGDHPLALATLARALGLWRGRAFQEVVDHSWAQPEAARLEELRSNSVDQMLRARLAAGQHEEVVAEAEAAVAEQPLREQRWATLILALYRCGRQADALRAYQRLRSYLAEELGIDPSPPVVALEAAILRQDPGLDLPVGDATLDPAGRDLRLLEARAATSRRDWQRAFDLFTAADQELPLEVEDLERLGDVAFMAGEQDSSIAARQRAHSLWLNAGQADQAAIAALLIVGNYYVRNRPAVAAGWFHKARRLIPDLPESPAHGVLAFTAALIAMAQGQLETASTAAAEAQRIGHVFADLDTETVGLTLHGCALARLGRLDEALPMLDEALATASTGQLGPVAAGQIFCWTTQALLAVGDYPRAAEWIETIDASGVRGIPGDCRVHRAEVLRALGRLDQAESEASAARSEIQAVDLLHVGIVHYELAMIHLSRGDLDAARHALDLAAACGSETQPGLALLRLARGEIDEAVSMIDAALSVPTVDPARRARLLPVAVQIATAAGDGQLATERIAELQQVAIRHRTNDEGVGAVSSHD